MMILKEAEGITDQKLFGNCQYNILTRSAIGFLNAVDSVPTESTYYLFRKRVNDYAKAGNENLFAVLFAEITQSQCVDLNVSGKRIRMDSKLLGSNIAWLSRYELVHETLQRVFNEQFKVYENQVVVRREKEEISAQFVHFPHDTDCNYRKKDGNKVKGYSINVTESCDEDKGLNLIGHVDDRTVNTSDVEFFQNDIERVQEVFPEKIEFVHADGVYHSPGNQTFCKDNEIELYLHAIQGAKGRNQFIILKNGDLSVLDTKMNQLIKSSTINCKNNITKWRIETGKVYRYFTKKEVNSYLIRKQIAETPIKTLQFINNVEAIIFQLGYHYSNAKSRYRGLIKHQMWANIRCLWVNFVRILKYINQICQKTIILFNFNFLCLSSHYKPVNPHCSLKSLDMLNFN